MFVDTYLIQVYIIPEKFDDLMNKIKSVSDLKYGNYKWVYWKSAEGEEFYNVLQEAEPNEEVDENKSYSNKTIKIEFSIPRDDLQLEKIIKGIWEVHPWKEPVIRILESKDSRKVFS